MRGKNITNVYIIDGQELNISQLTKDQLLFIETNENRTLYNEFRNSIIENKGDDIECVIRITMPEMVFDAVENLK